MRRRRRPWLPLGVAVLLVMCVTAAFTASSIVAASRAAIGTFTVTANNLKPSQCAALNLTRVRGIGSPGGTAGASLFVGNAANNTMVGGSSSDCIVGGAGNDAINGAGGTDVCLGGAGTDTFTNCETAIQ